MTYQNPGLAERAYASGLGALADVETLELFLSRSMERGAGAYAQVLLARFGSLPAVLAADLATLASVIGRQPAVDLKILHDATQRLLAQPIRGRDVMTSWAQVVAYLKHDLQLRTREQFRVLFLDKKNQLIADEVMSEGTTDHAPVYTREVIRRALELGASAMILAHNHPSGDPTPSGADIAITRELIQAAKLLRLAIHDHVVVGASGVASFKALGLI